MIDKIREAIHGYSLIEKGDTIIVGVSGGADSVCLLHLLNSLKDEMGFSLEAAHLNHMIRGEEASRDESFVKELCKKLGVKLFTEHRDIPSLSKGKSLEETGREERYKFFLKVAGERENVKIAVAHNLNDLAETMIMRMARGTSVFGAGGIRVKNGNIIRPMLYVSREEIESYLRENEISYVTDSTNLSLEYTRNRVRHKILPELKSLNGEFLYAFANASKRFYEASDFIRETALSLYGEIDGVIDVGKIRSLPKVIKEYIVSESAYLKGVPSVSGGKIEELIGLFNATSGKRIQLSSGIEALRVYDKVIFEKRKENTFYMKELKEGKNYIEEADYTVEIITAKKGLDREKVKFPLYARPRVEGDTINPAGMSGTKKIKTLFNDEKIGVDVRNRYPVIISDGKIIFALGRCDRELVSDENTKEAFVVKIHEGKI